MRIGIAIVLLAQKSDADLRAESPNLIRDSVRLVLPLKFVRGPIQYTSVANISVYRTPWLIHPITNQASLISAYAYQTTVHVKISK